jgi:hypothetical protein
MTNSTEVFWSVDGVSLQTLAFNITTLGDDREAAIPLRGSDIVIPYMPGSKHVTKVPDSRILTLGMWVIGANEDGSIPVDENVRRTYDRNWKHLRRLLWRRGRQFTLTKRFWVPEADLVAAGVDVSALQQSGLWRLYTAEAQASYSGGLDPRKSGPARAVFTVDLRLADPYFYGPEISVPFSTAPADAVNPGPSQTISVLGDDRTTYVELDFVGPVTTPRVTNSTELGLWVQYSTVVAATETATVRAHNFSATHYPVGTSYKSSGYVTHAGDRFWMFLEPGSVQLELTVQAGTGTAELRYRPVWM